MQELVGKLWPGYKIDKVIGEGSFGKVYQIRREEFGYEYLNALKIISIPSSSAELNAAYNDGMDEASVTTYFRSIMEDVVKEVQLMYQLKGNSNIVNYEDHRIVPHNNGVGWDIYIRMELLTPFFEFYRSKERTYSNKDVAKLGIDICKALEVCQTYKIIHRDIKPENIFISKTGNYKLGDFGIARQMEKTASAMSKKGTYLYMAPEVFRNEDYDLTVDIYSLGIVLYRFLNQNKVPFLPTGGKTISYSDKELAMAMRMKGEAMPMPVKADLALGEIVLRACAYHAKDRYQTPTEMRKALEKILRDLSTEPMKQSEEKKKEKPEEKQEDKTAFVFGGGDDDGGTFILIDDEEKARRLAEAKRKAAEEAARREEEARRRKEEEARRQAEIKRRREEEIRRREEEVRRREEEARREAEAQALKRAEEARRREEEARLREEEARRQAEEARRREEEVRRREEEARRQAEKKKKQEEEARRKEEARLRKLEEKKRREEEKLRNKPQKDEQRKKLIKILPAGAVVVVIGAVAIYFASTTKVPDVVGLTEEDAKQQLTQASLNITEGEATYSDDYRKGYILAVENAGKRIKKNSTVEITVSLGAEISMYDLVNMEQKDAVQMLSDVGLEVEIKEEYSDEYEEGVVMEQKPKKTTLVYEGDKIVLTVSKGSKPFELSKYVGDDLDDVEKAAKELGLELKIEKKYSSKVSKGDVISQSPKAGTTVKKGDTITLVVSKGAEQVKVPDLSGMTKSEAESALKKAGFDVGHVSYDYSSSVSEGKVLSQEVRGGDKTDKGSAIDFVISLGDRPVYTPPSQPSRPKEDKPVDLIDDDGPVDLTGDDGPVDLT